MTAPVLPHPQNQVQAPVYLLSPHRQRPTRPVRVVKHVYQTTRCELAIAALQPLVDDWDLDAWEEVSRLGECRCNTPLSRWCLANDGLAAKVLAGEYEPQGAA